MSKRTSKKEKNLQNLHEYLHKKVEEVEVERNDDRTWSTKQHLLNLKKQKLAVKDKIKNGRQTR